MLMCYMGLFMYRIADVDGGGKCGYDHCYARVPLRGDYDPSVMAEVAE